MAIDFFTQIVGEGAVLEVGDAELGGDGEPRWYGEAQVRHFGETGPLAAQDVAHGGRAVGPAVAEGIHPPLERPPGGSTGDLGVAPGGAVGPLVILREVGGGVAREAGVAGGGQL